MFFNLCGKKLLMKVVFVGGLPAAGIQYICERLSEDPEAVHFKLGDPNTQSLNAMLHRMPKTLILSGKSDDIPQLNGYKVIKVWLDIVQRDERGRAKQLLKPPQAMEREAFTELVEASRRAVVGAMQEDMLCTWKAPMGTWGEFYKLSPPKPLHLSDSKYFLKALLLDVCNSTKLHPYIQAMYKDIREEFAGMRKSAIDQEFSVIYANQEHVDPVQKIRELVAKSPSD